MKTMSLSDAQERLTKLVDSLEEGPILLLRKGQPCAALVGLTERFDREAFSLSRNKRLRQMVDEACQRTAEMGGNPFADILAEVEKKQSQGKSKSTRK